MLKFLRTRCFSILTKLLGAAIGAFVGAYQCFALCVIICSLIFWKAAFAFLLAGGMYGCVAAVIGGIVGFIAGVRYTEDLHFQATNGRLTRKIKLSVAKWIFASIGISTLLITTSFFLEREPPPPTSKKLQQLYFANKSDFADLAAALRKHDGDYSESNDPEPALIEKLSGKFDHFQPGKETGLEGATFEVWGEGMAFTDEGVKGYAYFKVPPAGLVVDIDKGRPLNQERFTIYQSLGDHWYLYYNYIN